MRLCGKGFAVGVYLLLPFQAAFALTDITIGLIFSFSGEQNWDWVPDAALYSMSAAVRHANALEIIPGANINLLAVDTHSTPSSAVRAAYEVATAGAFAVVGPGDSHTAVYSSIVTGSFNLPTCVIGAGGTKFADRTTYPNVFRLVRGVGQTVIAVLQYIREMGWSRMGFLYSGGEMGTSHVDPLITYAQMLNIDVRVKASFNNDGHFGGEDSAIESLKSSNVRIIFVAGQDFECTRIWLKAYRAGLVTSDFVWVTTNDLNAFGAVGEEGPEYNLTATPGATNPNILSTLGRDIASNTGALFSSIPPANESSPAYLTYLDNYNALYDQEEGDYWDYWDEDWIWDCAMAIFYGFGEFLSTNSLSASVLVNPNYNDPQFAAVTNLSIFNTSKIGMYGPYDFVDGDFVYQRQEIINVDSRNVVANFDPYTNVTVTETEVIGTPVPPINWTVSVNLNNQVFFGGRPGTDIPADHPSPNNLNPTWRSGQGAAFGAAAATLLATKVFLLAAVYRYRSKPVIHRASWKSLVMILMGLMLGDVAIFLYIGRLSAATCVAQPFLLNVAFGLVFSNIMAKTWRIYKIFNNHYKMSKPIQDIHLMLFSLVVVLVEILISIIWVAVSRPIETDIAVTELDFVRACVSPNGRIQSLMMGISLGFNGVLLVLTTILCYKTRSVASAYNETKWIGLSTYNIGAISALFLPLIFTTTFAGYAFILRSLLILLSTGVTEVLLFVPKLMQIVTPGDSTSAMVKKMFEMNDSSSNQAKVQIGAQTRTGLKDVFGSSKHANSFIITNAAVLVSSTGGFWLSWALSRWEKCNVTVNPGHIVVEILPASQHAVSQFKVFRTEKVAVRNESQLTNSSHPDDPNGTDAQSSVALKTSHPSGAGGEETEKSVVAPTTIRVVTLDGTMDLLLTRQVAKDLTDLLSGMQEPRPNLSLKPNSSLTSKGVHVPSKTIARVTKTAAVEMPPVSVPDSE
ncbi:7 transmembrane sweet-taste receptor of 3 GCPR-domain-containing protein [Gaertneriomyces semiglobifer]|nr:7 transmembrane sweet-taste receptor of 3 GCPR-domain-containing protein [Gaertneriomyces semiglobifer]